MIFLLDDLHIDNNSRALKKPSEKQRVKLPYNWVVKTIVKKQLGSKYEAFSEHFNSFRLSAT